MDFLIPFHSMPNPNSLILISLRTANPHSLTPGITRRGRATYLALERTKLESQELESKLPCQNSHTRVVAGAGARQGKK